jgi:hypothetical protein
MKNRLPLTKFEEEVLEYVVNQFDSDLVGHLNRLKVIKREYTGAGLYVDFEYMDNGLDYTDLTKSIGSDTYIELPELEYGAGCSVSISRGRIKLLELFVHGEEVFPEEITKFKFKSLGKY